LVVGLDRDPIDLGRGHAGPPRAQRPATVGASNQFLLVPTHGSILSGLAVAIADGEAVCRETPVLGFLVSYTRG